MSDWQPGDLALCVSPPVGDELYRHLWAPKVGQICTVTEVGVFADPSDNGVALDFAEDPTPTPNASFDAIHFCKIQPLNEAEHAAAMRDLNEPAPKVSA